MNTPNPSDQTLLAVLLDSWDRNNAILLNLLRVLPAGGLEIRAMPGSPTVAEMFTQPFQIPAFATLVVRPEILDRYVGMYASPEAPVRFTVTREGPTLFIQPGNQSAAALEATAEDKFQLLGGRVGFAFDAAKKN